ncbi:MAG TPA: AraC family transcriptional regulator [Thermoanaerobaculia bacterium]|nr:AraC family transcriptional regulator [Thermoanaerobaculia bacterium]
MMNARQLPHGALSETEHPPSSLPPHAHEAASFCFVTRGTFRERSRRGDTLFGRDDVIFRFPEERHSNTFLAGTVCFNVLFDPALLTGNHPLLEASRPILRQLLRRSRGGASLLTLEGLLLQLIGETFQAAPVRRPLVAEAQRIIEARFAEPLTARLIAAELSTHPVHLARTFRHQQGRGIGDAIRAMRIEHAKQLLREGWTSLAEIAVASGFADQSHFTKVFREMTGRTQARFRARLCSD